MNGGEIGTIGARIACSVTSSVIGRIPTSERQIFLTIDDGPTDESGKLAEFLSAHNISATWFMLGESAEKNPSAVKHIAETGHQFGNHSYRHMDAWLTRWSSVESDLTAGLKAIEKATGIQCHWTRPPYGRIRPGTFAWCRMHNQNPILWDVLAYDFKAPVDAAEVAVQIRSAVRPGSIVVMHDRAGDDALRTFEQAIEGLLSDGWTFGHLPHPIRT